MILLFGPPNPYINREELESPTIAPPLGLALIGGCLEAKGNDVQIMDLACQPVSDVDLSKILIESRPEVVGISCVMAHLEQEVLDLARKIKVSAPDCLLVIGGNHATYSAKSILEQCMAIDAVVMYDGEDTIMDVVSAHRSRLPLENIDGLATRVAGKIVETKARKKNKDLGHLPLPARHLLPFDKYPDKYKGQLITSRGCPFQCAFCATGSFHGRNVIFNPVGRVLDEIKDMIDNHNVTSLAFVDDTFTINRKRVVDLCKAIHEYNPNLTWTCETRTDVLDRELLSLMAATGCTEILFGIESPTQKAINLSRKDFDLEKAKDILLITNELGIKSRVNFIIGMPGDDEEVADRIIDFVSQTLPDTVHCCMLAVYPGTPMYKNPRLFGIAEFSTKYTADKQFTPMVITPGFNAIAQRRCYVRVARALAERFEGCPMNKAHETSKPKTLPRIYLRPSEIEYVDYQDYLVLIDPVTGRLAQLDPLSSLVWLLCDGITTCNEIAESMKFENQAVSINDVLRITENLAENYFLSAVE